MRWRKRAGRTFVCLYISFLVSLIFAFIKKVTCFGFLMEFLKKSRRDLIWFLKKVIQNIKVLSPLFRLLFFT